MGAIKLQSIQGFWAQLQAQALTARDVFNAGSMAHSAQAETQRETGLRSVAEIIAEYRGHGGAMPEVAHTASVDALLMHGANSPVSFAGSELIGCAFRCDSTEPVE